jgi:flagella basal body P-ring formation protein FlgA
VEVRAVEDGKAGDLIRVENTESKKVLRAKVLDEKKVLIQPEDVK